MLVGISQNLHASGSCLFIANWNLEEVGEVGDVNAQGIHMTCEGVDLVQGINTIPADGGPSHHAHASTNHCANEFIEVDVAHVLPGRLCPLLCRRAVGREVDVSDAKPDEGIQIRLLRISRNLVEDAHSVGEHGQQVKPDAEFSLLVIDQLQRSEELFWCVNRLTASRQQNATSSVAEVVIQVPLKLAEEDVGFRFLHRWTEQGRAEFATSIEAPVRYLDLHLDIVKAGHDVSVGCEGSLQYNKSKCPFCPKKTTRNGKKVS